MQETLLWKPRSRILVVIQDNMTQEEIETMLRFVWSRKILNILIYTLYEYTFTYRSFNPFLNNYFDEPDYLLTSLGNLNGYVLNILLTTVDEITNVYVKNIKNETIYSGKDGNLWKVILEHVNASYRVINLPEIYGLDNPWNIMNKRLDLEKIKNEIIEKYDADIIMDAQEFQRDNLTDNLYPHGRDDTVIIVPKAQKLTQRKQLWKVVTNGFYVILILTGIICPIIKYIIYFCECKIKLRNKRKTLIYTLINNIRLILGQSLPTYQTNFTENMFFIFLLYCNLLFSNYFQSVLLSIITVPVSDKQINTLQDIKDFGCTPVCPSNILKEAEFVLKTIGHEGIPFISVSKDETTDYPVLQRQDILQNVSVTINMEYAKLTVVINPRYHIVEEYLIPYFQSYKVVRDSPYYDLLEKYMLRIVEAGLYEFWTEQAIHEYLLSIGGPVQQEQSHVLHVMSLSTMHAPFFIYLIGIGFCTVIFILECCIAFVKNIFVRK